MSEPAAETVLDAVRRALGRTAPLAEAPVPPKLDEVITRLVQSDLGLPELFVKRAAENKMGVRVLRAEELAGALAEFLRANGCNRLALPASPLLEQLGVLQNLRDAGFAAKRWDEMTLDEMYDFDCGITDAHLAVAETGTVVLPKFPGHGKAISLVPRVHVAILEPKNFVPDLVDLFERLARDGVEGGTVTLITGPSKTSDIEMNLVIGVHGPTQVQLFVLQ